MNSTLKSLAENPEVSIYTLTGGEGIVEKILGGVTGMSPRQLTMAKKVAAGNPGAAQYLVKIREEILPDEIGFPCLLSCLDIQNLKGTRLYSFVKERGVEFAVRDFEEKGWC